MRIKDFRIDLIRDDKMPCGSISKSKGKKTHRNLSISRCLEKELSPEKREEVKTLTNKYLSDLSQLLKGL